MRRSFAVLLPLLPLPLLLATGPTTATTASDSTPYATLEKLYKPVLTVHPRIGWAAKVDVASRSEAKFLTASRELFYLWAKTECADWLADPGAYVTCHGDVHLGNIGTYVADFPTQRLAIGLVDFDESAIMPFQTDLLQAATSLRVTAAADGHPLDETEAARVIDELLAAYRSAIRSGQTATEALAHDPALADLLKHTDGSLRDSAEHFFTPDALRPLIVTKKGEVKERLLPALTTAGEAEPPPGASTTQPESGFPPPYSRELLAAALAQARNDSPLLARLLIPQSSLDFEAGIVDAALRYHATSGGSQGQPKVLIRLRGAVRTVTASTDAVIYLKAEPQPAAVRAGYIPALQISGGERYMNAELGLCSPQPDGIGYIAIRDESFAVSIYNPWTGEPRMTLDSLDETLHAAHLFGTILGAAHRNATSNQGDFLLARITPGLREQLITRSAADQRRNHDAYEAFVADPQVPSQRDIALRFFTAPSGSNSPANP